MAKWVRVAHASDPTNVVDLPIEQDGTLLLSSITSQFGSAQV